jgi:hypothetical protein
MTYGRAARIEGVSFLGVVLALGGLACGGESNNPSGISSGGTGAGRGGGTSVAGRGGSSASGGSAGSALADAGNGGGEGGGAGSSMGGASMGGSAGSGGRPEGCPEPNPIPVANQTIVLQSINFNTSELILRNATSTPQSITLGRAAWQWCYFPMYWSLSDQNTVLELAPGETYSFIAINNQSGPVPLVPEEGEMAIYSDAQDFNDFETMTSFVAWGDIQAYRESYAVQRGVWTYDERIEIAPGHAGFIATGQTDLASGYTSVPARCLVP